MNKNRTFDVLVKKALSEGEDNIRLNLKLASEAKLRLMSDEKRNITIMNRINIFSEFNFKKAAVVFCSIIFMMIFSFTFISPVRAVGKKVKTMIYDIVKGKDGEYVPVQVPAVEPEEREILSYEGNVTAVSKDVILKIPANLAGGYTFSHQGFGRYDAETGSHIGGGSKPGEGNWEDLYNKFNQNVSTFYHKNNSVIVLTISCMDSPFVLNSRYEIIDGDNKEDFFINTIQAEYAEYPAARYPINWDADHKAGDEDRTRKPTIRMMHTIKWEYNGLYYKVYDFNCDLDQEELKPAAESVIESMM